MRPSIFALFKRGKYFHTAPTPTSSKDLLRARGNTREAERFAAAAIAFSWLHHPTLRRHFWNTVCRFPGDPPLSRQSTISIEPEEWADLLITNPTRNGRFVYVIERKIGAKLEKHQDPTKRSFGRKGGYGRRFVDDEHREGANCRFILLGPERLLKSTQRPWNLPLKIQERTWEEFATHFPATALARDVALCLGKLGVGAFPASDTKTMKVNTKRADVGNAVRTLAEVQRRLEWPGGRGSSGDFYQEETRWFLGVELKHTSKSENSKTLRKLVEAPARAQAWLGYEGEEGEGRTELSLYVYCVSNPEQCRVAKALRAKLKGRSKDFQITEEERDKRYFNVKVSTSSNSFKNDAHWFGTVLEGFGLKLIP